VLAKCAAYDGRTIGEADAMAWREVLHDIELIDALTAVTRHHRESTDWAMPAHVRRHALAIRDERRRRDRTRNEALALPSRFEADEQRDARIAARIAACRAAIRKPSHAAPATDEPSALDVLRDITPGPDWADPTAA